MLQGLATHCFFSINSLLHRRLLLLSVANRFTLYDFFYTAIERWVYATVRSCVLFISILSFDVVFGFEQQDVFFESLNPQIIHLYRCPPPFFEIFFIHLLGLIDVLLFRFRDRSESNPFIEQAAHDDIFLAAIAVIQQPRIGTVNQIRQRIGYLNGHPDDLVTPSESSSQYCENW